MAEMGSEFVCLAIFLPINKNSTARVSEFLEGPPSEDEARTEVLDLIFSRSRTRPRLSEVVFQGRDEALEPFSSENRG